MSSRFLSRWRDTIVLALDQPGLQLYEKLNEAGTKRVWEDCVSELKLDQKSQSDQDEFVAWVNEMGKWVSKWPFFRRTFAPSVTLFNLNPEFDLVMQQVVDHLDSTTRLVPALPVSPSYIKIASVILVCLFVFLLLF